MHRLAHLVLSAALLGTAARSPNHGSLRSQLEPASSEVSGKLSCPGGAAPTLKSVYVRSADEGLSSWRIVLAELLVLAHMTGAALIEPCVHKSRLVACDVAQSKGYNRVLVSNLFDVPALSTFARRSCRPTMRPVGKPIAPCACMTFMQALVIYALARAFPIRTASR